MGNRAIDVNGDTNSGGTADIHITTSGSDWYFTVASILGLSAIVFWALSVRRTRTQRLFYYLAAAISLVSAIAYFTEGSNLGWTPIQVEFTRSSSKVSGFYRQIFYVRYIDYFITSSLILLTLFLSAALPWPTILYTILIVWVFVVSLLVGALVKSTYKWGYFTFALVSYFFLAYTILFGAREHAAVLGGSIYRTYISTGGLIVLVWLLYLIAWGVSEGGNVIAPDSEAVFYGILDLLAKPVFGALLIWGHQGLDIANLGFTFHDLEAAPATRTDATDGHSRGFGRGLGRGFSTSTRSRFGSLLRRNEKSVEAGETGATTNGHETAPAAEAPRHPEPTHTA